MRRLTGADGYHLYEETRVQHMHTIKIAIIDRSTAHEPLTFEWVASRMGRGMVHIPPFRWQLAEVPLRIGHPVWVDRPDIDINYHLRRAAVPAPGGQVEFDDVVSQIASVPLEREHPLWQLWFVEGLADDRVAYVLKMHHALADGVASADLLMMAFQDDPEDRQPLMPDDDAPSEPMPSRRTLFRDALRDLVAMGASLPHMLRRTVAVLVESVRRRRAGINPEAPFNAPPTRFDDDLTPQRLYVNVTVPLSDLKAVKQAFGCTINDVYLTMVGGAVRHYLAARDELPDRSLTASMPRSIRRPDEADDWGNRVTNLTSTLGTNIADPIERLAAVHASTEASKTALARRDERFSWDWQRLYWIWKAWSVWLPKAAHGLTGEPVFNVVVSNVAGSREPRFAHGARLAAVQSMGPIIDRMGLNATAWSYVDDFSIGLVACRDRVPDLRELADRLPVELAELVAAATARTAASVS